MSRIGEDLFRAEIERLDAARDRGDADGFEAAYAALINLAPRTPDDALALAEAHLMAGAYRACLAVLRDAGGGAPMDAVLLLAGKALRQSGDDRFVAALRAALACRPDNAEALALLARHTLVEEDPAALPLYRRAAALAPADYDILVGAAAGAFAAGAAAEAEAWAARAIAAAPERPEAFGVLGALHRGSNPRAALDDYLNATARARTWRIVPVPPHEGIAEGNRGLCDTIFALIRGAANLDAYQARQQAGLGDPKLTTFSIGNLRELAAVPEDGRFHPRDPHGSVHSLRLFGPEIVPLAPPVNYRPVQHKEPFLKSSFVNWYRDCYRKFAWNRTHPFPGHFGTDGGFITRVDGGFCIEDFVFSSRGEYVDESTMMDELLLAGGLTTLQTMDGPVGVTLRKLPGNLHFSMPCALLSGYHINTRLTHYACWLLDVAPKLRCFEVLEETRDLPIILPERGYRVPYVRETLDALGVPASRLIRFNTGALSFDRLYLAQSGSRMHTPSHMDWMRRRLFESFGVTPSPQPRRRFYLSRGDTTCRRVVNEEALMRFLEQRGFERLESTPLSMRERVQHFAEAECVVGVSGAGMANILFCPPSAKIVEVFPATFIEPMYWMVANHLKLDYFASIEERVINHEDDFMVSLERLGDLLDEAGVR